MSPEGVHNIDDLAIMHVHGDWQAMEGVRQP